MTETKLKPNMKFGEWTTIKFYSKHTEGKGKWWCKCSCGHEKFIRSTDLTSTATTMCKSCSNKLHAKSKIKPNDEALKNKIVRNIRKGASDRGWKVDFTYEEIFELSQNPCFYCEDSGSNMVTLPTRKLTMEYNGLDRVDNTKGYTKENVVTCCIVCNRMKMTYSLPLFLDKIKKIHNNLERILERSETIPEGSTDQVIGK